MKRRIPFVLLALLATSVQADEQADEKELARKVLRGFGDAFVSMWDKDSTPSSHLIGGPPPPFALPSLSNPAETLTEAVLSNGPVTVLNFWASWCVPCKVEHPQLMRLAGRDGVQVIGINTKDSRPSALSFLSSLGDPFAAIGSDKGGRTAIDFGVIAFPETFVIAGDGTVLYKHVGPILPEHVEVHILPAIEAARTRGK